MSTRKNVAHAIDGKGIFWICAGCECLCQDEKLYTNYDPEDYDGYCAFEEMVAKGVEFDLKCEIGQKKIKELLQQNAIKPLVRRTNSIF